MTEKIKGNNNLRLKKKNEETSIVNLVANEIDILRVKRQRIKKYTHILFSTYI